MRSPTSCAWLGWAGTFLMVAACWAQTPPAAEQAGPEKPQWKVGDCWVIETAGQRIQVKEFAPAARPVRVRWRFRVAGVEKVAGRDCFRLEIECLAQGRTPPKTIVWCDQETLFLRQFQTEVVSDGHLQTVRESYEYEGGTASPVIASLNAIPLSLPAFLPKGAKALGSFAYTTQPLPAGSKDPSLLRFSQTIRQEIRTADPELASKAPRTCSKGLEPPALTQVTLEGGPQQREKVVQLWQAGAPWPVYVDNGRTQAWLVESGSK